MNSVIPQLIVASTVSAYWLCVIGMSVRSWTKFRVPSGSLPKTRLEKRMWMIWLPTIVVWISLLWNSENRWLELLTHNGSSSVTLLGSIWLWSCAIVCVGAFFSTIRCWMSMGKNWSMAVRPDKKTDLITDGVFAAVRHPIYALSLLLMISSFGVVSNFGMLIVATIHCALLVLKSRSEEIYLTATHGQQYRDYLQRTSGFFPWRALMQ